MSKTEELSKFVGVLTDRHIRWYVEHYGMIQPFIDHSVSGSSTDPRVSYGLSSFGYDVRLSDEFKLVLPNARESGIIGRSFIDPKQEQVTENMKLPSGADRVLVMPGQTLLGSTMETFDLPRNVMAHPAAKSTYARVGISVNFTVLEPGWRGQLTLEISNVSRFPVAIYPYEGIAQLIFHASEPCMTSYDDRDGKYQDQEGVVAARMKGR